MGLAGRKTKQRIGADPRNLTWANDASKFGTAYLEKFGWASGSGLGVSGEGRTKHISVYQKLDMLGVGADHKNSQDGTAWKQGRDFENLLRRLNAGAGQEEGAADVPKIDGFVRPSAQAESSVQEPDEKADEEAAEKPQKSKKRKHDQGIDVDGSDDGQEERRKKKKDKKDKKGERDKKGKAKEEDPTATEGKEKKRKRSAGDDESATSSGKKSSSTAAAAPIKTPAVVRRPMRAHRARHIAMKGMASKSATAIAEILGVSPSSTATPSLTDTPDPSSFSTALDTPASASGASAALKMQDLTTSSKSVMDYFREKLAAKSNRTSESSTPTAAETPVGDDYDDRPRGGLGLGASRLRVEAVEVEDYDDRPRGGLGSSKLAMPMGAMSFVQSSTQVLAEEAMEGKETQARPDEDEPQPKRKSKKRKRKEDTGGDATAAKLDSDEGLSSSAVEQKVSKKANAPASSNDVQPQDAEAQKRKKHKRTTDELDATLVVDKPKKRKRKRDAEGS